MGMVDNFPNEQSKIKAYTIDVLSTTIVSTLDLLASDEEIFKLLYYTTDNSLGNDLKNDRRAYKVFTDKDIIKHGNENQRIKPYPFSPKLQTTHECFIRCYFNQGNITRRNNSWSENQMNIDIICSHGLWLTADKKNQTKIVRPYAILSRIMDRLQETKGINKLPQPSGFQHFTINENFECLRIYANTKIIEKDTVIT